MASTLSAQNGDIEALSQNALRTYSGKDKAAMSMPSPAWPWVTHSFLEYSPTSVSRLIGPKLSLSIILGFGRFGCFNYTTHHH